MKPTAQHLEGFIDLLVEAVLRDLESDVSEPCTDKKTPRTDGTPGGAIQDRKCVRNQHIRIRD